MRTETSVRLCYSKLSIESINTLEQVLDEIVRLKELSTCRKPVGICSGSPYSAKTVVCDDGSCFIADCGKWTESTPIPGTRADVEREK
jgi:hypothetical protein